MSDAADVRDVLLQATASGRSLVRVRLDDLTFTDSSGLGVFLAALHAAERAHCAFEVVNPQPRILRLFQVAGVVDTLCVRTEPPLAE